MPTIDTVLRNVSVDTWFGDLDLGEMFLNYPLHEDIQPYAGIDITEVEKLLGSGTSREDAKRILERWNRMLMGFTPSPYIATQTFAWSEEIIIGDYSDPSNPFHWDTIVLNLPGTDSYQPDKPWILKWNSKIGSLAAFFTTYIDDIRSGASSESACRKVSARIAARINYLGQQDASRKRGHPAQSPRPWAGGLIRTIPNKGLFVLTTQLKWDKAKRMINDLYQEAVVEGATKLSYKRLEKEVGFLCHLTRTYSFAFPFLKGYYNTLNKWRLGRDADGWKLGKTAWLELIAGDIAFDNDDDINLPFEARKRKFASIHKGEDKPEFVTPVPRLNQDLSALKSLFTGDTPKLRLVRGCSVNTAAYAFGDASGTGFGASWENVGNTHYRIGSWGNDMYGTSSNLKELTNLVDTLKSMRHCSGLVGHEIFLFTDNKVSEEVFYNGTSSNSDLFSLVLELKKMEMHDGCKIRIIHVAGTRMQSQGTDGLSRGNLSTGIMGGSDMLSYIPIHLSPLERSPTLKPWIIGWTSKHVEFLKVEDWFTRGHDHLPDQWEHNHDFDGDRKIVYPRLGKGFFIWSSPPCIAHVMAEELRKCRHKRQLSTHIVLIPRLMSPYWRKQINKASDLVLSLPPGHNAWPSTMHEPLTIAFIFPFLKNRPWQLRGSIALLALGRELSRVWKNNCPGEKYFLWKLWHFERIISSMPSDLAWKLLQSENLDKLSYRKTRKRRGSTMEKEKGYQTVRNSKKRRHDVCSVSM